MTDQVLQALRRRNNHRGLVIVQESVLLDELEVSSEALRRVVGSLEAKGLVEILSPLPFLVLKWSGKAADETNSNAPAYSAIQLSHKQQLNSSYRQARAHRPIDQTLLGEILETVGETDGTSFEKAVELYSPHVIRTALDRVRKAKGIRKNRTALFRHLLPRLARDEHRFDQLT
jgi:hypothetical protein